MPVLPPIVSFVARSGTGKTTYLEGLIDALGDLGVRVMAVKHDVHGFEVDREGKDTWRFRQAGARQVLIANAHKMALMGSVDGEQPLRTLVARYARDVDLVLTEGYRRSGMPKVLVQRQGAREPMDMATAGGAESLGGEVIAVASDYEVAPGADLPRFALDRPADLAAWLVDRFVAPGRTVRALTGVVLASRLEDARHLDALVARLDPLCEGGVLVVRPPGVDLPPPSAPCRIVDDLLPQHAALGGLFTGLALAETPHVLLVGCDQPALHPGLVAFLRDHPARAADVLLPERDGRPEPLPAVYGSRCLGAIKSALLSGELRMDSWHGAVRVERIAEANWRVVDPGGQSFG